MKRREIDQEGIIDNFKKLGFEVEVETEYISGRRPDLLLQKNNQKYIVEIKRGIISRNHLFSVIYALKENQINYNADYSIIVSIIKLGDIYLDILDQFGIGYIYSPNREKFVIIIDPKKVNIFDEEKVSDLFNELKSSILSRVDPAEFLKEFEPLVKDLRDNILNFSILTQKFQKEAKPEDRVLLSGKLIKEIKSIEKFLYKKELNEFIRKQRNENRYLLDITMETLKDLWTRHRKGEVYKMFENFKEFEPILFKQTYYRDHFIHQFQVFLLGCPIINKYMNLIQNIYGKKIEGEYNNDGIFFSWLLASSFHDIGYPIQQFPDWISTFFDKFLHVKDLPLTADFSKLLTQPEKNFLEYIDNLCYVFEHLSNNQKEKWSYGKKIIINNKMRSFILEKLLENRNHGIISALSLLDIIEHSKYAQQNLNYKTDTFSPIVVPAALAILLHDSEIYKGPTIKKIDFNKNPLSFLLIYCDTVQEWGRPSKLLIKKTDNYEPLLTDIKITKNQIFAELSYLGKNSASKSAFKRKKNEVEKAFEIIKSKNPKFSIEIKCPEEVTQTYHSN